MGNEAKCSICRQNIKDTDLTEEWHGDKGGKIAHGYYVRAELSFQEYWAGQKDED